MAEVGWLSAIDLHFLTPSEESQEEIINSRHWQHVHMVLCYFVCVQYMGAHLSQGISVVSFMGVIIGNAG